MLRMFPVILSIIFLGVVALWIAGGLVDLPLPFIEDSQASVASDESFLSRLETRLEEAPIFLFVGGAVICAGLLLAMPRISVAGSPTASRARRGVHSVDDATARENVEDVPLLAGPRMSIPEKIDRLKELRRDTRQGDTASMKAVRLHQRMLERAGRFEHD